MGIPVPITPKEMREMGRMLRTQREVLCFDDAAYIKALLVAQHRLNKGQVVKAKIVRAEMKDLTKVGTDGEADSGQSSN